MPGVSLSTQLLIRDSRNVHGLQFLEKQLRSVRDVHLRDLRAIPAN